jgi:hypothetical protein
MKTLKYSLFIFVALLIRVASSAQSIAFDKIVYDYGIIPDNAGKVESVFVYTNIGKKPLVVTQVKPSCGCTTSDYTKDSIAPGQSGYIRILFNPQGYSSVFSKSIKVTSNAVDMPEVNLTIKGTVKIQNLLKEEEYPYQVELVRLKKVHIDFGEIKSTEIRRDTVQIYNPQDTALVISFPQLKEHMKVEMYPQNTLLPNAEGIIILTYDPIKKNEWGQVSDKIYLAFEGKKNNYRAQINVSGNIVEDFSKLSKKQLKNAPKIEFSSKDYNFDTIQQGQVVNVSYKFKNVGKMPLKIHKVKTSCGCTAGQLDKTEFAKGEDGEIKVTFNSAHKQANVSQRITIVTNDPKNTIIELVIHGFVKVPEVK